MAGPSGRATLSMHRTVGADGIRDVLSTQPRAKSLECIYSTVVQYVYESPDWIDHHHIKSYNHPSIPPDRPGVLYNTIFVISSPVNFDAIGRDVLSQ